MPRHFLVKRHKHCSGTLSYRDRLQVAPEGIEKVTYNIIDTDKYSIIREGDYISDYSGYGSPDSGYAASPNSSHMGFAREKENLVSENNNHKNFHKVASLMSYYENVHLNMTTATALNHGNFSNNGDNNFQDADSTDVPIDLSMSSRKKTVLSSVPAYLQQEESHHQHHQKCQQQQQQQQHAYHSKQSPNPPVPTLSASSAVMHLDAFSKFFVNNNNSDRSLPAMMPQLSPTSHPYSPTNARNPLRPDTHGSSIYTATTQSDGLLEAETTHTDTLSRAHCIYVPSVLGSRRPSSMSPLSSPSPAPASETVAMSERATPENRPSSIQSPNRKRGISDDNEEVSSELYFQELSKSLPALKKRDCINESVTTPISKTSSSQKARTTAPAAKKSPGSIPSGKKMKAVRRLNFDIDTTSPVSGTIIKDAADFHPEDGKVVYGDIEPSFNFVDVTPEARAELEKIENKIGDYICQLCKEFYEDAFQLAQHRCSRIVHVEYRCPECEKVFNCPANLASHRRWHKPRVNGQTKVAATSAAGKIFAAQKIAPKPDCNSNNITQGVADTSLLKSASPNSYVARNNSLINNGYGDIKDDIKGTESISCSQSADMYTDRTALSAAGSTGEDAIKQSTLSSNSECKENGCPVNINVSHTLTSPAIQDKDIKTINTTRVPYTPTSDKDSVTRLDSVIAINPLHSIPVTYGSSLTSEERSLVLQVLSCHNRRPQSPVTTSTTTAGVPFISDIIISTDKFSNNSYHDEVEPVDHNGLIHQNLSQEISDRSRCSSSSSSSSSSPPLDLTQTKYTHLQQHQQDQRQTELYEHQSNPQIGCPVCGKKFQRQAYLRKHIMSQHGKQNSPAINDERAACEIKSSDSTLVISNQATANSDDQHSNTTSASTSCNVCSKRFTNESARLKHESLTHGLTAVITCSTCSMTFTSKAALDKHSRYAHATETFSCKYCSSTFHSSPGLTRHINKCHPTENRRVILLQLPTSRTC